VGGAEQYQVIPNGHDDPRTRVPSRKAVAIVTGGSSETGREVARALAGWGWAIVVVYLEHQPTVEATVADRVTPEIARQLSERGISVGRAPRKRCSRSSTGGDGNPLAEGARHL
jgi:NAD(P)-dependent dehydrogenase (short-subunit alcohol dehydrogenase family)